MIYLQSDVKTPVQHLYSYSAVELFKVPTENYSLYNK
jgi:hypothetical protein